jgi:site-specific DNA recombinase
LRLNDRVSEIEKQQVQIKKEQTTIEDAILSLSLPTLISKFETKYVEQEELFNKLETEKQSVLTEVSKQKKNIERLKTISINTQLSNLTEREKSEIFKNLISRIVYYSVDNLRGFAHIQYKNGMENIIAYKRTRKQFVSYLPTSFRLNTEDRKIMVTQTVSDSNSIYPNVITTGYTFKELEASFDMKSWTVSEI